MPIEWQTEEMRRRLADQQAELNKLVNDVRNCEIKQPLAIFSRKMLEQLKSFRPEPRHGD